jgi:hypothetical protein
MAIILTMRHLNFEHDRQSKFFEIILIRFLIVRGANGSLSIVRLHKINLSEVIRLKNKEREVTVVTEVSDLPIYAYLHVLKKMERCGLVWVTVCSLLLLLSSPLTISSSLILILFYQVGDHYHLITTSPVL